MNSIFGNPVPRHSIFGNPVPRHSIFGNPVPRHNILDNPVHMSGKKIQNDRNKFNELQRSSATTMLSSTEPTPMLSWMRKAFKW